MVTLFHFSCVLIWSALVTAQTLQSPPRAATRGDASSKPSKRVGTDVKRTNNGDDILVNPLVGKMYPYIDNIAFDEPCLIPQKIKIAVDTGSSDTWIDASTWCDCDKAKNFPAKFPQCTQFNALKKEGKDMLSLQFDDGFEARGILVNTKLRFGVKSVDKIWLLAASDFSKRPTGLNAMSGSIGLGYTEDQKLLTKYGKPYYTLPQVLEQNKNTTSNAYSMWFSKTEVKEDFSGSILFGGYVSNYFKGPLSTFDVQNEEGIVIQLDRIRFKDKVVFTSCDETMPVMLDTGSFNSYLPSDTFQTIADKIGPHDFVENKIRQVAVFDDCSKFDMDEPLYFEFGNTKISVPLGDIVRRATNVEVDNKTYPSIKDPKKQCISHGIATWPGETAKKLGLAFSGPVPPSKHYDSRAILGITFLRHAFIVYDLPQSEVSIAAIDPSAVAKGKPEEYSFNDKKEHQSQPGYNPVKGATLSCPVS